MGTHGEWESEVSELRKEIDNLRRKLALDDLTGLMTRQSFYEFFENNASTDDVLVFIDLYDFKSVNDGYGFNIGDALLARTAQAIKVTVPADCTVARLAGDEFLIHFCTPEPNHVHAVCAEVLGAISACAVLAKGLKVSRNASIGMTRIDNDMVAREAIIVAYNGVRVA